MALAGLGGLPVRAVHEIFTPMLELTLLVGDKIAPYASARSNTLKDHKALYLHLMCTSFYSAFQSSMSALEIGKDHFIEDAKRKGDAALMVQHWL